MRPRNAGMKVVRVYTADGGQISSTAAHFSTGAFAYRVVNTAGTIDLQLWNGTPGGGGSLLSTFADFTQENASYVEVFKWFKITKISFNLYPIVDSINDTASGTTDQEAQASAGLVHLASWNGAQDVVSSAGVVQIDNNEFRRLGCLTFRACGRKGVTLARIPNQFIADANIVPNGYPQWEFPKARPIETGQLRTASNYYPVYGFQYFWQHVGLNGNSAKFRIGFSTRVECQWNTLYDAEIAAKAQKDAKIEFINSLPRPEITPPVQDYAVDYSELKARKGDDEKEFVKVEQN